MDFIHLPIGIVLTLSILLQNRASGLSATFGGTGSSFVKRRGAEQVIYKATIWLSFAFFGLAVIRWYL